MPFCISRCPSTIGKSGVTLTGLDRGVLGGEGNGLQWPKAAVIMTLLVTANKESLLRKSSVLVLKN